MQNKFYTRAIRSYLEDIINSYHYTRYAQVTEMERSELAGLFIEAAGKDGEAECLVESPNLDQIAQYLKNMLIGTREHEMQFVNFMREQAIDYYNELMEEAFNHVLKDMEWERWSDTIGYRNRTQQQSQQHQPTL